MRTVIRSVMALAVVASTIPSLASAENFYAAVRGGLGVTTDAHVQRLVGFFPGDEVVEFKTGFTGGVGVGYRFPFGLRVEGEFGYLYAPLKRENFIDVSGSMKSYLLMANAYYDFAFPFLGPFRPYVGGGLGVARVNDDHEVVIPFGISTALCGLPPCPSPSPTIDIDKWRTAFAYQARAGIVYDVNRWLDLSLGYRYVHVDGGIYGIGGFFRPARGVESATQNSHSVELGFAIKF
jgi:opacity protein-like surface antigen